MATVNGAALAVTVSEEQQPLAPDVTSLTIKGTGFDDSGEGTNVVTLSGGSVRYVNYDSSQQLTVFLTGPLALGPLMATVTIDGVVSSNVQVANVEADVTPEVTANTNNLADNATTLIITGANFDPAGTNSATRYSMVLRPRFRPIRSFRSWPIPTRS